MAISILSNTQYSVNTDTSPISFSHATSNETKLLLFGYGAARGSGTVTFSSVTYNGDALTSKITKTYISGSAYTSSGIWALLNPDIGTYNIVATPNAACNGGFCAINIGGISLSNPYGSTHSNAALSASVDTSLTLTIDQIMVGICGWQTNLATTATLSTGTAIYNNIGSSTGGYYFHKSSGAWNTGVGTKHCSWTLSHSYGWSAVSLALNAGIPSGGEPAAISPFFNFFKNFENPWTKKGGLWQPSNPGLQTI